uniref:Uncharacterized protein n=1 Tax=Micrurus spixii TaxID=129469 RepID=A0A2D4MA77_9SAUR
MRVQHGAHDNMEESWLLSGYRSNWSSFRTSPAKAEGSLVATCSGEHFCFRRASLESDSISWQRGSDKRREEGQQPPVSHDLSKVVSPAQVVPAISFEPFFGGLSTQGQQAVE